MGTREINYTVWGVAGLVLVAFIGFSLMPPGRVAEMDLDRFGRLPLMEAGRIKPFDSLARNTLVVVGGGRATYTDNEGSSQPATRWLLDVVTSNEASFTTKLFRIENDQVLQFMKLEPRSGFRYSEDEITPRIPQLMEQAQAAEAHQTDTPDLYQSKVLELAEHYRLVQNLRHVLPTKKSLAMRQEARARGIVDVRQPRMIPPTSPGGEWANLADALLNPKGFDDPAVQQFIGILQAYHSKDAAAFNEAVAKYEETVASRAPAGVLTVASAETTFNEASPFYNCIWLYIAIFLITCAGWAFSGLPLGRFCNRQAFALLVIAVLIHSVALISRMIILWRPPVTNLYSSAVFIGWGCVLFALVIEKIMGLGVGTALAAVTGAATLFIANFLAQGGETMEKLAAVLDTNFWLATHVVCVTLGYTATFVAGFLAIFYILWGVGTPFMTRPLAKGLWQVMYGVVCFATLLSFVGTVLGGIWADQSWGRFWGWDSKENGAVLVVIWNALILHARWGGLVKERGMAVLTVVGNMVTGWSWFGTNQLGVGLHAYGFNKALATSLTIFWISQLVIIGLGLLPLKYWWSFRVPAEIEVVDPNSLAGEGPGPRPRRRPRLA